MTLKAAKAASMSSDWFSFLDFDVIKSLLVLWLLQLFLQAALSCLSVLLGLRSDCLHWVEYHCSPDCSMTIRSFHAWCELWVLFLLRFVKLGGFYFQFSSFCAKLYFCPDLLSFVKSAIESNFLDNFILSYSFSSVGRT